MACVISGQGIWTDPTAAARGVKVRDAEARHLLGNGSVRIFRSTRVGGAKSLAVAVGQEFFVTTTTNTFGAHLILGAMVMVSCDVDVGHFQIHFDGFKKMDTPWQMKANKAAFMVTFGRSDILTQAGTNTLPRLLSASPPARSSGGSDAPDVAETGAADTLEPGAPVPPVVKSEPQEEAPPSGPLPAPPMPSAPRSPKSSKRKEPSVPTGGIIANRSVWVVVASKSAPSPC